MTVLDTHAYRGMDNTDDSVGYTCVSQHQHLFKERWFQWMPRDMIIKEKRWQYLKVKLLKFLAGDGRHKKSFVYCNGNSEGR